jgi:hypothetical protein
MPSIAEEIQTLEKQLADKRREGESVQKRTELFPDLEKHVGRRDKVAYASKLANPVATEYDMRHNCGCCRDSPLEIWPYTKTEFGNVYSNPPKFYVGERNTMGYGDIPKAGWALEMRNAGIPEPLIEKVKDHFRYCRDQAREHVDSSYEEDGESEVQEDKDDDLE